MVCPAIISSRHRPRYEYVPTVSLADNGVVQRVPVFGSGVHPRCLLAGWELEDSVCDEELMLRTEAKEPKPIVIAAPMTPVSNYWTPNFRVFSHAGIKVTEYDQFVPWWYGGDEFIQLVVELFLGCLLRVEGRCIN